ncbi:helix-turn-helix domain-containing protein [Pediococcus acidilactici]|nr:helix-turn-helix domain-containing protein [Pediococcus acidilactici]UWF33527.1 helix-turn-helix transcriptional regulator [Pediococcus acidilactici]
MATWNELRKKITKNIPTEELNLIETLTYLQERRIKLNITQKELGKRIGMAQSRIAKIESLDSTPSLETLNRYAHGLGLEIKLTLKPFLHNQ